MVNDVPEGEKAPQQQQLPEQRDQHQEQSRFSSSCTCSQIQFGPVKLIRRPVVCAQSVDSSLGGLSRSSTVASLDTDSTKSSGQSPSSSSPPFSSLSPPE